jgi:hypothetical protein
VRARDPPDSLPGVWLVGNSFKDFMIPDVLKHDLRTVHSN